MRNLEDLNRFRLIAPDGWRGNGHHGVFRVPSPIDKRSMTVIASDGSEWKDIPGYEGLDVRWDHVSVSRETRCPNWIEMDYVKRLFFLDDEVAVQFHVPSSDHVNMHSYCLHMWRCQTVEMPRPPSILVGVGDRTARDKEDALRMMQQAGL